jgi:hypothetical protein
MVLARKGFGWSMPRLRAIIHAPTLRPDGSVISEPGYDEATGLLLVGDRLWRHVPDNPSKRDAGKALAVLSEPIAALPFVAESDRAAALALLLTSVLRPSLKTSPMFAVTAPSAGTGKSLTVDVAAIMATGRPAAVITPTADEAELEKRIGASALAGDAILSIDNVTHILRSDQLCQMLTQDEVQVRVLGSSKNVRIPSTGLICVTGNNLCVYGDLNRRTIQIRLDAQCERPEEREFQFDPIQLALRKRPELVAAALTIVRAYWSAGTPSLAPAFGGFEAWSDLIRSALIWLGLPDCRGDVAAQRAADPEKDELAEIVEALPTGPFTTREIAAKVSTPTGKMLLQFKSFAIASNQRVLIRGLQEDTTRFVGVVVGMTAIGAFIYALKQIESGRPISDNPGTWIAEGLDRSGIFSVAFEINNALEKIGAPGLYTGAAAMFPDASQAQPASRYAVRSKFGSFLGPSFGGATDTVGLMALGFENMWRAGTGDEAVLGEGDIAAMRRLTPFASLPYFRWLIDGMIVPEMKEAVK